MNCKQCGKETSGSIGAAGFKHKRVCQECQDRADKNLLDSMVYQNKAIRAITGR